MANSRNVEFILGDTPNCFTYIEVDVNLYKRKGYRQLENELKLIIDVIESAIAQGHDKDGLLKIDRTKRIVDKIDPSKVITFDASREEQTND